MDPSPSYTASSYFADFGLILFALFLVLLNGFFVAAEFAMVKLRATKVEAIASRHGWRGHILRTVHQQLDAYLSACQLGITLASLGLGWVGEPAFAHLLEPVLASFGIQSPALVAGIAFFTALFIITCSTPAPMPSCASPARASQAHTTTITTAARSSS